MPSSKRQPVAKPFVPLTIRFDHALLFAAQVHRNQDRKKTGIPYLSHLLGVAAIVLDYGGDEDMGIAALLHDVIEDTKYGASDLRAMGYRLNANRDAICRRFTDG